MSYGFAVPEFLRIAIAVVALALAAFGFFTAWRGRAPIRAHLYGVAVLELLALALVITTVVSWARGHRVNEPATLGGYLFAFLIVPPAGAGLARMEPTRWGSLIIGVAGLVEAVLVLRLQQLWSGGA